MISFVLILSGYQLWHHPNADNLLRPPVEEADKAQDQSKGKLVHIASHWQT